MACHSLHRSPLVLAGVAMALAALVPSTSAGQQRRNYSVPRHVVKFDNVAFAPATVHGGSVVGEVVASAGGGGVPVKKQIGGVRYEDLVLETGLDSNELLQWIADSWAGKAPTKDLRVIEADFNYKAQRERMLMGAVVAATTIPALDGSSREPARLTVRVAPERVATRPGDGQDIRSTVATKQTAWLASNFRLELDGLPTNRVARIDSFTVQSAASGDAVGATRLPTKPASRVEFPNLTVHILQADEKPWTDWFESFVVQGKNDDSSEKNGAIVFLSPNLRDELGRVALSNCGIVRLSEEPAPASSQPKAQRLIAELYCEQMALQPGR